MSTVTVVGLDEVEPIELPGGSWSRLMVHEGTASAAGTTLGFSVFNPGTETSHMSHDTEELAYVVSGRGLLRLDDGEVRLAPESACHIPAGVWHTVVNDDTEAPMSMVFVFASPGYPPTERRDRQDGSGPR